MANPQLTPHPTAGENWRFSLVVKKDCPTCAMLQPAIEALATRFGHRLRVYVQDDPQFLADLAEVNDDRELGFSWARRIETVPTMMREDESGAEVARVVGWDRQEWRELTGLTELGAELPPQRPGCGSRSCEPGMAERLALAHEGHRLRARQIALGTAEDAAEACFERGWTDGLPVVPPTPLRVMAMIMAGGREPDEVVGEVPPNKAPGTVEKVAVNAVLAGCKPEYFPLVLRVVEAALDDRFCMHGLLCTTWFSGPVAVVNGPVARRIGMNSGVNALGQGNRANATIGRALQLLIRNVGGGKPGGIDRATLGNPGKYTYCFAEDESDERWTTLAEDRGLARGASAVSLFAGDGLQPILDQQSREPESLARSMAEGLRAVAHPKLYGLADAILVVSPEHRRVLLDGGWDKQRLREAIYAHLNTPGEQLARGADGIAEGMPATLAGRRLDKFRADGLHIVTAGGTAGLFSAIISGWVASGERGSVLVTRALD